MNWSRGENKLIILFLSINLLLGMANYRKETGAYTLKENQVQDIINVLDKNNIKIDSNIPIDYRPMKKLTVLPYQVNSSQREEMVKNILGSLDGVKVSLESQVASDVKPKRVYRKDSEYVTFDGESISYINENIKKEYNKQVTSPGAINIEKNDINRAKKLSEKWLSNIKSSHKDKHVQLFEKENGIINIIYYDKYEDMPIFDSYIKFVITPLGICEVNIHKVELGEITGNSIPIYSADQICFYLMREISQDEPIHIKDIVIGYALENPKGTHLIAEEALPFYQVMLEDGSFFYVNAYNSEIREQPKL